MVHALEEGWRVLKPGGILVDIRPYLGNMRLELLVGEQVEPVGLVDDSHVMSDHHASNQAMEQGQQRGLFEKMAERFFDYTYIWDTPQEFKDFTEENWEELRLKDRLYRRLQKTAAQAGAASRVRIQDVRIITRYRKLDRRAD